MTQGEANASMVERFEKLLEAAEKAGDTTELVAVTDSAHKLFITLSNAGAFAESKPIRLNGFSN